VTVADLLVNPQLRGRYPTDRLEGCETALLLFAAGFYGRNDGAWVAEAGIRATCVDLDTEKLSEMQRYYPASWDFVYDDVFAFALLTGRYDLVSVDPPSALSKVCLERRSLWTRLAKRQVVLGSQYETIKGYDLTNIEVIPRNKESVWLAWAP